MDQHMQASNMCCRGLSQLLVQGDTIQDSLTDVPLTQERGSGQKDKDSDTFLQVLNDNSSVIVSRGPGGSVKITKAPDSGGTSEQTPSSLLCLQCSPRDAT